MTATEGGNAVLEHGFALIPLGLGESALSEVERALASQGHGQRHLLALPPVAELARSETVRGLAESALDKNAFAVSATFFNKRPESNWKVTWHQDVMVTVKQRRRVRGWGPWSEKAGVMHVRPPLSVMERMVAVRIHLDECGGDNGPLRVIPDSHEHGYLRADQIEDWRARACMVCAAKRGDALLMRPLLLHASSAAVRPGSRRVIHLEFAADDLPDGMEWFERIR